MLKATRPETYDKDISKRHKSPKQPLSLFSAKICARNENERESLPIVGEAIYRFLFAFWLRLDQTFGRAFPRFFLRGVRGL